MDQYLMLILDWAGCLSMFNVCDCFKNNIWEKKHQCLLKATLDSVNCA